MSQINSTNIDGVLWYAEFGAKQFICIAYIDPPKAL